MNPTIGSLDLKSFCELRPGLIGWLVINISMACEQAVRHGGTVTDSMLLICLCQGWYVADALYLEVSAVSSPSSLRPNVDSDISFLIDAFPSLPSSRRWT